MIREKVKGGEKWGWGEKKEMGGKMKQIWPVVWKQAVGWYPCLTEP